MHKFLLSLKRSYETIRDELFCSLCSFVGLIKAKLFFSREGVNRLEIGIGASAKKEGFITADISLTTDYPTDLRTGLPFPDASIDFIYAEHVLEHFSFSDLKSLLDECHRVLKPEGCFSVVVPDATIYLNAYFNPESFDPEKFCLFDFGLSYNSKIDYVNYIFYMGGEHRYMFDRENLVSVLSESGFGTVNPRDFDPSLDKKGRSHESLYVDCYH